jgi:acyl dehydratase
MTSLADLAKGHKFTAASFELSDDWVNGYTAAVEDSAIAVVGGDFVPPMAVAALSVRALLEQTELPPGSLHAAQELSFLAPVRRGETLSAAAGIVSRGERAGWVLMGIELSVERAGTTVMTGRATLSFPTEGAPE